ncbi:hypothetical protein B0H13DRAFT_2351208 [Mycena leptocephala]|nr:hypothetical protein B0H13DRAFT_2351208 [Mycena leptocephala]
MRAHFFSLLLEGEGGAKACAEACQGEARAEESGSAKTRAEKAAPKPAPKPVKAAAPKPVKAAPKPAPKPPAAPAKASKVATTSKGLACPIRKKGSKAAVKARGVSDTEDCDGASAAELCASFDDCATCVGAGLQCAFDVKGDKCVPETTTGLTLATSKKTCDTLLAAEQAAAPPAVDHGSQPLHRPLSANQSRTIKENKRDTTTGIVEFQNGNDIKTVWNDVNAASTFVYTQDQIKTLCLRGYELSILANPSNAATLKAPAQPAASTSMARRITSGLDNGFVVHNPFINQNVCINISSASCFPLGTGTASGAEGSSCTGDAGVGE